MEGATESANPSVSGPSGLDRNEHASIEALLKILKIWQGS